MSRTRCGHDDADEGDRTCERHGGTGGERRAHKRDALGASDVHAACGRRLGADAGD